MNSGTSKTIVYTGPSMNPALKGADVLGVLPYEEKKIRCGDMVVFHHPKSHVNVVHRVTRVDKAGVRTRGDKNNSIDPWILNPNEIIGRVIYAKRGNKQLRIYGGIMGCLFAVSMRASRMINIRISALVRPFYHLLARSGIFRKWLPHWLETRVLSFDCPGGKELQLFMGHRLIGRFEPDSDRWVIRRPFKLFVDEATLPRHEIKK